MTNYDFFMNAIEQLRKIDIALMLAEEDLRVCKHNNSVIEMTIENLRNQQQKLGYLIAEEMYLQNLEAKHAQQ